MRSQKGSHKLLQLPDPSGDYRMAYHYHYYHYYYYYYYYYGTGRDGTGRDGTGWDGMGRDGAGRLSNNDFNNYYTDCFDSRIARVA